MTTLVILFISILAGFLLRRRRLKLMPPRVVTGLVWLLLFIFGVDIGSNREVIAEIDSFGVTAIILGVSGAVGAAIAALLYSKIIAKKGGEDER